MKNSIKAAALALATLSTATAAQAQDWTGAYVGAYVGGAYNLTSFMGGVLAGYQYQTGSFVIGAEGDAFMDTTGDYEIFAKLRAGVVPSEDVLLFGTFGVGNFNGVVNLFGVGVGAEVRMTEQLSIRADVESHSPSLTNVLSGPKFVKAGVVWSF